MRRKPLHDGTLERDFLRGNFFDEQDALRDDTDEAARVNLTHAQADDNYQRKNAEQVLDGWGKTAAASLSASVMDRFGQSAFQSLYRGVAGSIVRLELVSDSSRTAGTATAEVYIGGAASGLTAVLDDENTDYAVEEAAPGEYEYAAGAAIDVRVTTDAGWLPTSAFLQVILFLSE